MAAQFVKFPPKSQTTKNERNDVEAIAIRTRQINMRCAPVKSVDQQAHLAEHRIHEGHKTDALATSNRLRGILAEFGIIVPHQVASRASLTKANCL